MKKIIFLITIIFLINTIISFPTGPDEVIIKKETAKQQDPYKLNLSGGEIAILNINISAQNNYWKAIVGEVRGIFTLEDSNGSSIYQWEDIYITGFIYATRNQSTINWQEVNCATTQQIEEENIELNHTDPSLNITATFNSQTHNQFITGFTTIPQNSCSHSLTLYVNNESQNESYHQIILTDQNSLIYTSTIEKETIGYNSEFYDFQMLLPEKGTQNSNEITPYYIYIELI